MRSVSRYPVIEPCVRRKRLDVERSVRLGCGNATLGSPGGRSRDSRSFGSPYRSRGTTRSAARANSAHRSSMSQRLEAGRCDRWAACGEQPIGGGSRSSKVFHGRCSSPLRGSERYLETEIGERAVILRHRPKRTRSLGTFPPNPGHLFLAGNWRGVPSAAADRHWDPLPRLRGAPWLTDRSTVTGAEVRLGRSVRPITAPRAPL